ncbi:hypothetical protein FACS189418_2640 [Clostridia bacterium]|nr:hypothetical protein FACS189418_2640 [Clostridia bacterium]
MKKFFFVIYLLFPIIVILSFSAFGYQQILKSPLYDVAGWNGDFYYLDQHTLAKNQWLELSLPSEPDKPYWFYFDEEGRKTKWTAKFLNQSLYYFDHDGRLLTGWINTQTFQNHRKTLNKFSPVVYADELGVVQLSSWIETSSPTSSRHTRRYYAGEDGHLFFGDYSILGSTYKIEENYFAFSPQGELYYGLLLFDEERYYFDEETAALQLGEQTIIDNQGNPFFSCFNEKGELPLLGLGFSGVRNGRLYDRGILVTNDSSRQYSLYFDPSGQNLGYYLINSSGEVQANKQNLPDAKGISYTTTAKGLLQSINHETNSHYSLSSNTTEDILKQYQVDFSPAPHFSKYGKKVQEIYSPEDDFSEDDQGLFEKNQEDILKASDETTISQENTNIYHFFSAKISQIFPDKALAELITFLLGKESTESTVSLAELEQIKEIDYPNQLLKANTTSSKNIRVIYSLDGLQYLTSLTYLSLDLPDGISYDLSVIQNFQQLQMLAIKAKVMDLSVLKTLPNLVELDLVAHPGDDFSALLSLPHLSSLKILGCNENLLSTLPKLTQLSALSLKHASVPDLSMLKPLIHLNILDLQLYDYQTTDINSLAYLKNLSSLHLGLFFTPNIDISALSSLPKLSDLSIYHTDIENISILGQLENLTNLSLTHANIQDISMLKHLQNLQNLDLSNNRIQDISALSNLDGLKTLHLENNLIFDHSPLNQLISTDIYR